MPSTAETVAARVAAVLDTVPALAGKVYRDRQDAFDREESPSVLIELVSEQTQGHGGGPLTERNDLVFAVVYLTRSEAWQQTVDALRVAGHVAIQMDPTLNQLLNGLRRTSADWRAASADLSFGYCNQQYAGTFLTPRAALSSPA